MKTEEAVFLRDFFCRAAKDESQTTRKVIAAIPEAKRDFRPEPKAKTALELAWHLANSDVWFLESIAAGKFELGGERPAEIRSIADVLAYYDGRFAPALEKVMAMKGEDLAKPMDFFGVGNFPWAVYLSFMHSHAVHHRGQLSTYLRPMGAKVPSIYGGSADEPWEPPK